MNFVHYTLVILLAGIQDVDVEIKSYLGGEKLETKNLHTWCRKINNVLSFCLNNFKWV